MHAVQSGDRYPPCTTIGQKKSSKRGRSVVGVVVLLSSTTPNDDGNVDDANAPITCSVGVFPQQNTNFKGTCTTIRRIVFNLDLAGVLTPANMLRGLGHGRGLHRNLLDLMSDAMRMFNDFDNVPWQWHVVVIRAAHSQYNAEQFIWQFECSVGHVYW